MGDVVQQHKRILCHVFPPVLPAATVLLTTLKEQPVLTVPVEIRLSSLGKILYSTQLHKMRDSDWWIDLHVVRFPPFLLSFVSLDLRNVHTR